MMMTYRKSIHGRRIIFSESIELLHFKGLRQIVHTFVAKLWGILTISQKIFRIVCLTTHVLFGTDAFPQRLDQLFFKVLPQEKEFTMQ